MAKLKIETKLAGVVDYIDEILRVYHQPYGVHGYALEKVRAALKKLK